MCVFRAPRPVAAASSAAPPPVMPRIETDTALPVAKEIINPDAAKAKVEYGKGKNETSPGAGKKRGTDQLKIPLNTGGVGEKQGGANV